MPHVFCWNIEIAWLDGGLDSGMLQMKAADLITTFIR
jgi:hypothetical protein